MAKTSVYLPDDLAAQARACDIPVSEVAQAAVRKAVMAALFRSADAAVQFAAERLDEGECELVNDPPSGLGYASLAARFRRELGARRALIGHQGSDHAPVESQYGTVCRTCVSWAEAPDEGGETEFGIAIPASWPCKVARSVMASWADHPGYNMAWAHL